MGGPRDKPDGGSREGFGLADLARPFDGITKQVLVPVALVPWTAHGNWLVLVQKRGPSHTSGKNPGCAGAVAGLLTRRQQLLNPAWPWIGARGGSAADENRLAEVEFVQQNPKVRSQRVVVVAGAGPTRGAAPATVVRDDAVSGREQG